MTEEKVDQRIDATCNGQVRILVMFMRNGVEGSTTAYAEWGDTIEQAEEKAVAAVIAQGYAVLGSGWVERGVWTKLKQIFRIEYR